MKRQEITDRVNALMSAKTGIEPEDLEPDDKVDALGMESIEQIEVAMEIEQEFAIRLSGMDLLQIRTLQDVYDAVEGAVINQLGFRVF